MAFSTFNKPINGYIPYDEIINDSETTPDIHNAINNHGVLELGEPIEFTIQGSVQPTSTGDLSALPEGRRDSKTYTVYTRDKVKENSVLIIDEEEYLVVTSQKWKNNIIQHYKLICAKISSI